MGRLFSSYQGTYHVEWGVGPEAKKWKSKSIDAVARVVCETCNNGWMSDLDAQASATMSNMIRHGSAVSLLPIGIASIAMFAYKAAVVVNCAGNELGGPFFPPAERKRFSEDGHFLPGGIQIWLSTYRGPRLHGRYEGHYAKINTGRYRNFRVFVFTYTVGGEVGCLSNRDSPPTFVKPTSGIPCPFPCGRRTAEPFCGLPVSTSPTKQSTKLRDGGRTLPNSSPTERLGASVIKFCDLAKVTPLYT